MINEIISAISRTLDEKFECTVYAEPVTQGLTAPCFLINIVDTENQAFLNKRSNRIYNFDVVYISKSGAYSEMYTVADKMIAALNVITLVDGTRILSYSKRYEIVDDNIHFFLTYQLPVIEKEDNEIMQNYSLKSDVGGF